MALNEDSEWLITADGVESIQAVVCDLNGILRGKRYTYQWLSMLCLLYLTEGVLRASDPGLTAVLAGIEIALSVLLFFSTMMYARNTAPSRQTSAQPGR